MWRATIKGLLAHRLRFALTGLAVVLGVGFTAGTYVLTDTMGAAFDEVFGTTAELTDVIVRSRSTFRAEPGGDPFGAERSPVPDALRDVVRGVPGVAHVVGDVEGYAQIVDPRTGEAIGGGGPPTIGSSWDGREGPLRLREGRAPDGPEEVAIDATAAAGHGISVGDRVLILSQGPPRSFTVVGIVGFGDAGNLAGATLALFDPGTAQGLLGREGEWDQLSVTGEEGVSPAELRDRVAARLPEGFEAVTSAAAADELARGLGEALGFFRTGLLVFAGVAVFVGAFLIFNTFSIVVAQRTRELGLLRTLGATAGQVMASVLAEALLVGVAASAVGIGLGILIALGLRGLLEGFGVSLPSARTQLLPRTVAVSLLLGTLVTVASALLPARRAGRVSPLYALRDDAPLPERAVRARRTAVGAGLLALGVGVLARGLSGDPANPAAWVGVGAGLTFLGAAALAPFVVRPVLAVVGAPVAGLGVPGKLGRANALRNPRRTAATAAALMVGIGLVSFVAVFGASLRASADRTLRDVLRADFVVSSRALAPISPAVARALDRLPEVGAVSPIRQGVAEVEGRATFLSAVEPGTIAELVRLEVVSGSLAALERGAVVVAADLARSRGWSVGDVVEVRFPSTGTARLEVGAIVREGSLVGSFVITREIHDRSFRDRFDAMVLADAAPGVRARDARRAIEAAVRPYANLDVDDQAGFRRRRAAEIDQLLGLLSALLGLAILIALVGIANTLGLSIVERTRELGLLRALGMTRAQVRRMVRAEAVLIAVLGALLGLGIGLAFGWAMQRAIADEGVREFRVPGVQLAIYVAVAGVAGVAAAALPARRAARLDVLRAIAYE